MATETRWFVTRLARATTLPKWGAPGGLRAAIFEFLEPEDLQTEPGRMMHFWWGSVPVDVLGIAVGALTFDTVFWTPAKRQAVWAKLQAANDARVFDFREDLSGKEETWSRRDAFANLLSTRTLDVARFRDPTKSLAHHLRELLRELLFRQALGRHQHALPPAATLDVLATPALEALRDHLLELGIPSAKIPSSTTTFRDAYRSLITEPRFDFGLESGGFFLGHKDAHLRKR